MYNIYDVSQRCKDICSRHKATRPSTDMRYLVEQKLLGRESKAKYF